MKTLFYCDTPYQVLTALNFHRQRKFKEFENLTDYSADLFVVNQFKGAHDLVEKIRQLNIFDNVFVLKRDTRKGKSNKIIGGIYVLYDLFFPKSKISFQTEIPKHKLKRNYYDEIIASFMTHFVSSIISINPDARFHMMDDGTGSYFGNIVSRARKDAFIELYSLIHRKTKLTSPEILYVNNKEMCKSELSKEIVQIPNMSASDRSVAEFVFGKINNIEQYEKEIIFMTQMIETDGFEAIQSQFCEELREWKDNVLLRVHPRDTRNLSSDLYMIDNGTNMWELVIGEIDIENRILVSYHSTALLTPSLLYGKQPVLVFLHKCVNLPDDDVLKFDAIVDNLKMFYKDKNRVIVVERKEDFKSKIREAKKLLTTET